MEACRFKSSFNSPTYCLINHLNDGYILQIIHVTYFLHKFFWNLPCVTDEGVFCKINKQTKFNKD